MTKSKWMWLGIAVGAAELAAWLLPWYVAAPVLTAWGYYLDASERL